MLPNPLPAYLEKLPSVAKKHGRIISVARLQRVKRIDRLIEAFALIADKYQDWYIDVYGDGEGRGGR